MHLLWFQESMLHVELKQSLYHLILSQRGDVQIPILNSLTFIRLKEPSMTADTEMSAT